MALILLTQQSAEELPLWVIILFVVIIVAVSLAVVRSQSRNAVKGIQKMYSGQIVEECSLSGNYHYCFVTGNELVLQYDQNTFKAFKLNSIKYIYSFRDIGTRSWAFAVEDENKKGLKGEWISGVNGRRKLHHATLFFMPQVDADKLCDFIIKHAPHVEKAERYSS